MDVWCEDCGAQFRNQCQCADQPPPPARQDRWVGIDGHAYVGERGRPSGAWHDTDNCRCPQGARFDPESWY